MSGNVRKQTAIVASIVMGLISVIVMGALKKSLSHIPFFRKFLQLQNLGLDSMKDFLELSELNLRTDSPGLIDGAKSTDDNSAKPNPEEGHLVIWDSDGSHEYTMFIASEYLGKLRLLTADSIPKLKESEIPELRDSTNWIRKLVVSKEDAAERMVVSNGIEKLTCSYPIPFEKFNCRIRSSHGRVSRHLQYPNFNSSKTFKDEIDAWLVQEGEEYHFCLRENYSDKNSKTQKIHEFQIVVYISEGKGAVRTVPPFKDFIKLNLGRLPPSLCYLTGVKSMGTSFEQFVGWVNQRSAFSLDGVLKDFENMDHEDICQLQFE